MISRIAIVLALAIAATAAAAAETAPPAKPAAPAPVSAAPQSTSATFGDWVLRCQRQGEGAAAAKVCEVAQTIQAGQQHSPVAQVALGRPVKGEPMHLTAQLPVNVSFPSAVKVFGDDKDTQGLELAWRRCAQIGCFADLAASDDQIQQLRARNGAGRLEFTDAVGRAIRLPLSFRGLAQALDALAKE